MAEQASLVQDGVDRINEAFRSIDGEFQRVQKDLSARRNSIEKRFKKSRKTIEKQSRKEVNRLRTEFRKNPAVKRAETLRKDINKQFESGMDNILGLFQIASRSDMGRIDRKLNALGRRIKEIEDTPKTNSSPRPAETA
jgi:hypothetical protein